jgi:hypothetical protein
LIKFVNKFLACLKSSGKIFMNNLDEDKFNVYINITEQSEGCTTITTTSNSHCADRKLCKKVCNFNTLFFYNFYFYFLLPHYTYNRLQIYLATQCQSLPISITKHCHTVYIQIHYLLVLPS